MGIPLRLEEGVGHRAADQQPVDLLEQVLDDGDLVRHLRPAHHRNVRVVGEAEQVVEDLELLLDQETDGAAIGRELLGDGHHRRLIAVAGAEGVVHVAVGERRESRGEFGIALLLALVEPDVLEHDDAAGLELAHGGLGLGADGVTHLHHRPPDQLLQPRGDRVEPERGVRRGVAGRPAEVADEDQAPASVEDRIQSRQGAANPPVVGDVAVGGLGHVEVHADQHFLAGHVEVANRLFGHQSSPGLGRAWVRRTRAGNDPCRPARSILACIVGYAVVQRFPSLVRSSAVRLE